MVCLGGFGPTGPRHMQLDGIPIYGIQHQHQLPMFATSMDGWPGRKAWFRGWHGWIAGKGDFTDIMYKVVLELAIEKTRI